MGVVGGMPEGRAVANNGGRVAEGAGLHARGRSLQGRGDHVGRGRGYQAMRENGSTITRQTNSILVTNSFGILHK